MKKHRLLKNAALALVVAAIAAPLAGAARPYDGYKSGYPTLHAILSGDSGTSYYDGYKSGYPQLHAILGAHITPVPSRGFDWRDASIGAGTAAGLIVLLAVSALLLMRRRTRLAMTTMQP